MSRNETEHNKQLIEQKIAELQQYEIPGKYPREKVGYIMQHYPYLSAAQVGEVLDTSVAAVHNAKYALKKTGYVTSEGLVIGFPKVELPPKHAAPLEKPKKVEPAHVEPQQQAIILPFADEPEIPEVRNDHVDIWDLPRQEQQEPQPAEVPLYTTQQPMQQQQAQQPMQQPSYMSPPQTPYMQSAQYTQQAHYMQAQQPIYVQSLTPQQIQLPPNFNVDITGVDGTTVRSILNIVYGKVADMHTYRVRIVLEER